MTPEDFRSKLKEEKIVPLSRDEWDALAPEFPEKERHNTQLAGDLILVTVDGEWVAVEEPSPQARTARRLGNEEEARAFVVKRLDEYERMWDGCGVKVEYYED